MKDLVYTVYNRYDIMEQYLLYYIQQYYGNNSLQSWLPEQRENTVTASDLLNLEELESLVSPNQTNIKTTEWQ